MAKALRLLAALLALLVFLLPGEGIAKPTPDDPLPVGKDDASRGTSLAPVTLIVFTDMECPFCARLHTTLDAIRQRYDERQLRIVTKHFPLDFHKGAHEKAQAAQAVLSLFGEKRFAELLDASFADMQAGWRDHARAAKLSVPEIERVLGTGAPKKKVDADIALGKKVSVRGTPAMFVNGLFLSGARPEADIAQLVDEQLVAAKKLRAQGTAASEISGKLTRENFKTAPPPSPPPASTGGGNDREVWKVPVGTSPQIGPADALVTLVVFSDFQCPYCARVRPTLEALRKQYGSDLRVVFKHRPLPFHKRAEPAAQLATEAFVRLGAPGFWKAHDLLFDNQSALEDADLARYARTLGLDPAATMAAVRSHKHKQRLADDELLAAEVEAKGTPHHFVNGRKLVGAQPIESFVTLIDEERDKARKLRAQGVAAAKLYDHLIKNGKTAPPPEHKSIPAPTAKSPVLGSAQAPVTIQVFTDFKCPYCARVQTTLAEIQKEYGQQVRIVFRHKPLDSDPEIRMFHHAAAEAFRQKGNAGFWKMHDAIYDNQRAVDRSMLDGFARDLGLDMKAFSAAIASQSHHAAIEADVKISEDASITSTPSFVINGYFIGGAQPLATFRRAIALALRGK